jgi:hypothetical protein
MPPEIDDAGGSAAGVVACAKAFCPPTAAQLVVGRWGVEHVTEIAIDRWM